MCPLHIPGGLTSYCEITSLGIILSCLVSISSLSVWYVFCCCFSFNFSSPSVFVLLLLPVFPPHFNLTMFLFWKPLFSEGFFFFFWEVCLKKKMKLIERVYNNESSHIMRFDVAISIYNVLLHKYKITTWYIMWELGHIYLLWGRNGLLL